MSKPKVQSREHPIIFTSDNVKLILDGKKWETRRLLSPQPTWTSASWAWSPRKKLTLNKVQAISHCPFGDPGDLLWVRETWKPEELEDTHVDGIRFMADNAFVPIEPTEAAAEAWVWVNGAAGGKLQGKWRPNIHMPKWACRLRLKLNGVKLERVRDITEMGAQAEGMRNVEQYRAQWRQLHGKESWSQNPWVWVLKFSRLEGHA